MSRIGSSGPLRSPRAGELERVDPVRDVDQAAALADPGLEVFGLLGRDLGPVRVERDDQVVLVQVVLLLFGSIFVLVRSSRSGKRPMTSSVGFGVRFPLVPASFWTRR